MVTVLYSQIVKDYDIKVHKVKDDVITLLVINANQTSGSGRIVHSYDDADEAVEQGKQYAKYVGLALEAGFNLHAGDLSHPSGAEIQSTRILDTDLSEREFTQLLKSVTG